MRSKMRMPEKPSVERVAARIRLRFGSTGDADDVAEHRLRPADLPHRRDVAVRHPVEDEDRARARVGRDDLVVDRIDLDRLRPDQTGLRPLDDAQRRLVAARVAAEHEHRAGQRHRDDDLVVEFVVREPVHRAAEVRLLSFDVRSGATLPFASLANPEILGTLTQFGTRIWSRLVS